MTAQATLHNRVLEVPVGVGIGGGSKINAGFCTLPNVESNFQLLPWTMDIYGIYSELSLGEQDKFGEMIRNQKQPKFQGHSIYLSLKCLSVRGLELSKARRLIQSS
jgi:hypothetical protein